MEVKTIQAKIYELRGQKVIFDFDLAFLYDTETKRIKEAVRRNPGRFPKDFVFQLSASELKTLRTQIATSRRGGLRYPPFAFTEEGVAMLSSVLKSKKAIQVNIAIMRTFVFLRQYALTHKELTQKLKELETKYDRHFKDIYEAIRYLMQKDKIASEQNTRKRIGFRKE